MNTELIKAFEKIIEALRLNDELTADEEEQCDLKILDICNENIAKLRSDQPEQGIIEVGTWQTENLQESVTIFRTDGGGLLGIDSSWLETQLDGEDTDRIYDPADGSPLFFREGKIDQPKKSYTYIQMTDEDGNNIGIIKTCDVQKMEEQYKVFQIEAEDENDLSEFEDWFNERFPEKPIERIFLEYIR